MLQRGLNEQRLVFSEGKRELIKIDLDQILPTASSKTDLSKRISPAWSVFSFFSVWPLKEENRSFQGRKQWSTKLIHTRKDQFGFCTNSPPSSAIWNALQCKYSVTKMHADRWSLRLNTNLVCLVVFNDVPYGKECKRQWYMWAMIWCFIYSYLGWISELYQFFRLFGSYRWCTGWER